jgi:hypothetical protein
MPAATAPYSAFVDRVRELDGAVFTEQEAQRVREAADARLFGDRDQGEAVKSALALLQRLVEGARLSTRTCQQLAELLDEIEPVGAASGARAKEAHEA